MATKIILKKSSVAASIPAAGTLEPGELAINLADRVLYSKDTGGTVFSISGSGGTSYTNSDVDAHLNTSTAAGGEVLSWNGTDYDWIATGGTGTVTSVSATVPAGFTISGSPITGSGTLVFDYATGYQGYTTAEATKLSGIESGADVTDAANVEPLVDLHLNTSTAGTGEVLSWNGTDYDWVAAGSGGGSTVYGDFYLEKTRGKPLLSYFPDDRSLTGSSVTATDESDHIKLISGASTENQRTIYTRDVATDWRVIEWAEETDVNAAFASNGMCFMAANGNFFTFGLGSNGSNKTNVRYLQWSSSGSYAGGAIESAATGDGEPIYFRAVRTSTDGIIHLYYSAAGHAWTLVKAVDTVSVLGQAVSYFGPSVTRNETTRWYHFLADDQYDHLTLFNAGGASYTDSNVDTHLNTATAATGEVLSWNGTDYDWVAAGTGGTSYTDTDVDTHLNTSTAATGEVLTWNGSDYVWSTATRRTIDGGFASSVYTTTQSVDGGSSSTVYASGQVINGGSA